MINIVYGSVFGDEGKARFVDNLSENADIIARYQGGDNAGHTVVIDGEKIVFHLVPAGILRSNKTCILGQGMVINPLSFLSEIKQIEAKGYLESSKLFISAQAHMVLPYHISLDKLYESVKNNKIGTTLKGIGPAYTDKARRIGIRLESLKEPNKFLTQVEEALSWHNIYFDHFGLPLFKAQDVVEEVLNSGKDIIPYISNQTREIIQIAINKNRNILVEGAQGVMLDVDCGSYPYVTSSNTIPGGACAGLGIPPNKIDRVIAIVKAYTTRVGEGPFPTEDLGEMGEWLRAKGSEYGATTGRPRRCGWLDICMLNYTLGVSGATELAISKLDVLSGLETIDVCLDYDKNGKPIYTELPGWQEDVSDCKIEEDLPGNLTNYLSVIESFTGRKISMISVGPDRDQLIKLSK
jgi:adenylosuccinate synthase